jgi:hypothetical protein
MNCLLKEYRSAAWDIAYLNVVNFNRRSVKNSIVMERWL